MRILSPVFKNNENIPSKYTCQGDNINPPLLFEDIPNEAKSLALIMDDPDAPMRAYVHWVLFDMPIVGEIEEDSHVGNEGVNTGSQLGYIGPCPPTGVHRYFFKLYALDCMLNLKKGCTKEDLEQAMKGHILAQSEIIGLYQKK